jgi:hypothetical protein
MTLSDVRELAGKNGALLRRARVEHDQLANGARAEAASIASRMDSTPPGLALLSPAAADQRMKNVERRGRLERFAGAL